MSVDVGFNDQLKQLIYHRAFSPPLSGF